MALWAPIMEKPEQLNRPRAGVQHTYGPAIYGVHWQYISADQLHSTPVLSLVKVKLQAGIDLSDSSSAPGKVWDITLEYLWSIPGCHGLNWCTEKNDSTTVVAMVLWETGAGWRAFQQSMGFCLLELFFDGKMQNKTIQLPSNARFSTQPRTTLKQIEICFRVDLDAQTRQLVEADCRHCISRTLHSNSYLSCNFGWVEHNASASRYATADDNAKVRTQCSIIILIDFNDASRDINKTEQIMTSLQQSGVVSHIPRAVTAKTMDSHTTTSNRISLDNYMPCVFPTRLTDILRSEIRCLRKYTDSITQQPAAAPNQQVQHGARCQPKSPSSSKQGSIDMPFRPGAYGRVQYEKANRDAYSVDVAWVTTKSTVKKNHQSFAETFYHRIKQLVGFNSGYWVRSMDEDNVFGIFTVWENETLRKRSVSEFRDIINRLVDSSAKMTVSTTHQSFPWPRVNRYRHQQTAELSPGTRIEVIIFRLASEEMSTRLFENVFAEFKELTAESLQSGPPDACRLLLSGWELDKNSESGNDTYTALVEWYSDAAREAWYTNLALQLPRYETTGHCLDLLKILAEYGVTSRLVKAQNQFP